MRPRVALVVLLAAVFALVGRASAAERQVPPMLAFERGGDIYRMTIDGSETVRLTATRAQETDPAASPDGLRIAYTSGDRLLTTNLMGGDVTTVLPARPARVLNASTDGPAWAPDGSAIYVARSAEGPNDICGWIYRVRPDGGGLRRLTKDLELDWGAAVSPDGGRIAFVSDDCEPSPVCCTIRVVDRSGRPTHDLEKLRGNYVGVAWSPDGSRVVLQANSFSGAIGLFTARRDGSGERRLTPKGLDAADPAWSTDGAWIAFAAPTRSSGYDLYLIHPDGTGLRRITTTKAKERSPSWIRRS